MMLKLNATSASRGWPGYDGMSSVPNLPRMVTSNALQKVTRRGHCTMWSLKNVYSLCCLIVFMDDTATCKKKETASSLLDKESAKYAKTGCKSTSLSYIMKLRESQSTQQLLACLIKSLQSSSNTFLYAILGETYDKVGEKSKASIFFREVAKVDGKVSRYVRKWYFAGPFSVGKAEVDGDPLEEWGGVANLSRHRWSKNIVLLSELTAKAEVKLTEIEQSSAKEPVFISPNPNWNELVMSLQSMGITEWQGWAMGDFVVSENDATVLFQCLGVNTIYIDGAMLVGDVYRRDQFWFPIQLQRGFHSIHLKLRAKGPQSFSCHIKLAEEKQPYKIHAPSFLPDILEGKYLFGNFISLPVNNFLSSQWLRILKVLVVKQVSGVPVTFQLAKSTSVAPGQLLPVIVKLAYKNSNAKFETNTDCPDVDVVLKLVADKGQDQKFNLKLRCRRLRESFLFTFMDHDGSVQHAAAIAPLKPCLSVSCPVLLTLHGTTVPPQNQADSYKRMEQGQWVFGVEHLWVLAPTRHGAHNWEGPGELTAMTALMSLAKLTKEVPWIKSKADPDHVVFAGHSMGGHGAWQLAIHYPDQALAVISVAGWIKKEDYGDSNLFFRHDVSSSHTDPALKAIMEACVAENDADKHVSNLQGTPVMIRVGADDKTVHPYFSRRMYRLLRQQTGSDVTYSEMAGKEHWWWDTRKTNDGGVLNDPVIRKFAIVHAKDHDEETTLGATCDSAEKETCEETVRAAKYKPSGGRLPDRNRAGDGKFTLTVYNPVACTGLRGVRVLQQRVPFRQSTVDMLFSDDHVTLTTTNVARLSLTEPAVSPVQWSLKTVHIDGILFKLGVDKDSTSNPITLCASDDVKWSICDGAESDVTRGPGNLGPARRVAESPFLIVTGTLGEVSSSLAIRQFAVYIANLFFLTSDTLAAVVKDRDLEEQTAYQYNLIIVGSPLENSWATRFHGKIPLRFQEKKLSLGQCNFTSLQTGTVFLAPHAGSRLALIISGNSLEGIRDAVHLATPTIPPMTRSPFSNMVPDYVITGPRFRARGPGGYQCAGFWGNHWEYRVETSSCVC